MIAANVLPAIGAAPQAIDALGKISALGAIILVIGIFVYAFLKGGALIQEAIGRVDKARSEDQEESRSQLKGMHETLVRNQGDITTLIRDVTSTTTRLEATVNALNSKLELMQRELYRSAKRDES